MAFDKDILILCLVAALSIFAGYYLAFIEPRKLKKEIDDQIKQDKMHFHSDLK